MHSIDSREASPRVTPRQLRHPDCVAFALGDERVASFFGRHRSETPSTLEDELGFDSGKGGEFLFDSGIWLELPEIEFPVPFAVAYPRG